MLARGGSLLRAATRTALRHAPRAAPARMLPTLSFSTSPTPASSVSAPPAGRVLPMSEVAALASAAASSAAVSALPPSHSPSSLPDASVAEFFASHAAGSAPEGSSVTVSGWVRSCRGQKNDVFLTVNDGTTHHGVQIVLPSDKLSAEAFAAARSLTTGASVTVSGTVAANPRQPPAGIEVLGSSFTVWGRCPGDVAAAAAQVGVPESAVSAGLGADGLALAASAGGAAGASEKKKKKKDKKNVSPPTPEEEAALAAAAAALAATPIACEPAVTAYPLQKKFQTLQFLREHPHLRLRTNTYSAIFRIRSESSFALHSFFHNEGFHQVHAPTVTPLDCEGAGELFSLVTPSTRPPVPAAAETAGLSSSASLSELPDSAIPATQQQQKSQHHLSPDEFFGAPAYMSVSGQLYGELAASAVKKVYSFGPIYRAEHSNTSRHLAEFWMLEPEVAFTDLVGAARLCEASIKRTVAAVLSRCAADVAFLGEHYDATLGERLAALADEGKPFARVTYTEAIEILRKEQDEGKASFTYPLEWGCSLQSEHERHLAENIFRGPVFVTHYPAAQKPFYMRIDPDPACPSSTTPVATPGDLRTVACFDLLVPGVGELCGGSQREERYPELLARMAEAGIAPREYGWYADLRRFGSVPHAGWGMGFERFIAYVTAMENVRDTTLVPRATGLLQI